MPKLIDYPRTSYPGAFELAEIVDETGGKCSIDNAAKKMDRKVSGSFKAIIGSAVKFGLITSKRELLSTTTLFKRIKHAYDKEEEMNFHREAFLAPPLFTQLCRKFRNRELPVQMLDVMLMREFNVEEINAQAVAKLFVEGCIMCGILNEANMLADIETLNNARAPKRNLSNPIPPISTHQPAEAPPENPPHMEKPGFRSESADNPLSLFGVSSFSQHAASANQPTGQDVVASLFNLADEPETVELDGLPLETNISEKPQMTETTKHTDLTPRAVGNRSLASLAKPLQESLVYQLSVTGPGINTTLDLNETADVEIAFALLEKIRRRFKTE